MNYNLSNIMSNYYLSSLYGQSGNWNYLGGLYGQNGYLGYPSYLSGLYSQGSVLGSTQSSVAAKSSYSSFQNVLAASIKGQNLQELLTTQFPNLKYHVMDTSKISASSWERNDYPFEKFFADEVDASVLDWKPTSAEPSVLDAKVQARLSAAKGKYAVIVPPELEEKMEGDSSLAQNIVGKIATLMMQQDTVPSTIDSFSIALDEDGNIANYRFSGGGGRLVQPTEKELQADREKHAENMRQQTRKHHL